MTDFNRQTLEIRQFLLGQLRKEAAEQLEESIFADPDFAEEVEIAESELIDDYHEGKLSLEERILFEKKYLNSAAGLETVEYESVFREFIQAKLKKREPVREEHTVSAATASAESETNVPPASPEQPKPEGWLLRFKSLFTHHQAFAILVVFAGLLTLLTIGFWYLSPWDQSRPPGSNSVGMERRNIEAELARLNTAGNIKESVAVDLKPMQRGGSVIARLSLSDLNPSSLIKLRLNLTQIGAAYYRAVFLDDRRNELFAAPNLTAQNTPDGPQVHLLVPAKYFRPGDYQISLSLLNNSGSYEEINSYALRVLETR